IHTHTLGCSTGGADSEASILRGGVSSLPLLDPETGPCGFSRAPAPGGVC
ncbi:unnamed protein product, partial [Ectocarpus sp. 13 AM-2016]